MVSRLEVEPAQQVANLKQTLESFFSEGTKTMGEVVQKEMALPGRTTDGEEISIKAIRYPDGSYFFGVLRNTSYLFRGFCSFERGFTVEKQPFFSWLKLDGKNYLLEYCQDEENSLCANLNLGLIQREEMLPPNALRQEQGRKAYRSVASEEIPTLVPDFAQAGYPPAINLVDTMMTYLTQERYFGGRSTGSKVTAESVVGNLLIPSYMSSEAF